MEGTYTIYFWKNYVQLNRFRFFTGAECVCPTNRKSLFITFFWLTIFFLDRYVFKEKIAARCPFKFFSKMKKTRASRAEGQLIYAHNSDAPEVFGGLVHTVACIRKRVRRYLVKKFEFERRKKDTFICDWKIRSKRNENFEIEPRMKKSRWTS